MIHNGRRKLPFDPEVALAHLRAADPKLGALIDRVEANGGFTLKLGHTGSPFTSLRLLYGGDDPLPQALLDTPEEQLRAAGVSGNKIKAFRDLAAKTLDGTVPSHKAILKMADVEIIERLSQVHGIGPWTVEMLLIFRLGRPDVFPVTDYGVRKGFALTFMRFPKSRAITAADLPKPDVMLRRTKRWAPYRSVAAWYMWRACDLASSSKIVLPTQD